MQTSSSIVSYLERNVQLNAFLRFESEMIRRIEALFWAEIENKKRNSFIGVLDESICRFSFFKKFELNFLLYIFFQSYLINVQQVQKQFPTEWVRTLLETDFER